VNNITKKVVLVTGGARGIGADICRKLALKGYSVAICYNSSEMEALELKQDLLSLGVDSDIFKADISNPNEVRKMFINIDNRFGSLYALVNNSGIAEQALFTDITDDITLSSKWEQLTHVLLGEYYIMVTTTTNIVYMFPVDIKDKLLSGLKKYNTNKKLIIIEKNI
jgi:3-oxoacyl-[acyl-carrier protein] reductase